MVVPDLPGFREAADPPLPPDMPTISAIVAAGIDHVLGSGAPFSLVGFCATAGLGPRRARP